MWSEMANGVKAAQNTNECDGCWCQAQGMWVISKNISIVISNADPTLIWPAIGWQAPVLGSDWSIMSSQVCSTPWLQGSDEAIDSLQIPVTPDISVSCSYTIQTMKDHNKILVDIFYFLYQNRMSVSFKPFIQNPKLDCWKPTFRAFAMN